MAVLKTIFILVLLSYMSVRSKQSIVFPIGGLFNNNTLESSRIAFQKLSELEESDDDSFNNYNEQIIFTTVRDSYSTALEVCKNTSESGIIALIDGRPTDGICDITCLLCNRLQVAHLSVGWEPTNTMDSDLYTFSYAPSPALVSKAYATLIRTLGWDRFSIFYEDDSSFVRLQDIIGSWSHEKDPITFRQLEPKGQNREIFKYVIKTARISHHIIDCDIDNIQHYMREIIQIENSTQYHSFILTNLDSHLINLKKVPEMNANISTMFMTPTDPIKAIDIGIDPGPGLKLETALTVDALKHLRSAIKQMQKDETNRLQEEGEEDAVPVYSQADKPALCFEANDPWSPGELLNKALLETKSNGLTGPIEFDKDGKRINFLLYYAKMNSESEFVYAGFWDSRTGIISQEEVLDRAQTQTGTIRVISRKGLPYFDIQIDENGEPKYRGFVVDLINEIFDLINKKNNTNFKPEFRLVRDGQYGNPIEGTKKWNGIMGELMEHTADLGACDLSISSERNAVVDFSIPFMTTGISMLFKEREPDPPDMFSFVNPLSLDVWLYLATTYIIVSFVFLICARMSNLDWVNPHPCNRNPENLENIWSFYNCTWFAMGTIMTQGCDILPRGLGSRWIAGMWWFFAMIVTASYTANMSTFLSNSRRSSDIKDAKELAEQTEVSYGAVYNASTYKFFKDSNDTTYAKIWQVMSSAKPTVFTKDNDEGKERVLMSKNNFAFFMESTAIKYYTERDCKLKMVGPPLDSKSYGIAMPKNFVHKTYVDAAILQLQESGRLSALATKWWKYEDNDGKCNRTVEIEDESLQMENTSGIFLVLGVGGILGLIVAVIDFLIHANKIAVKEKLTFKEAVWSEWNASLNPRTMAKPAAPPRSAPPSESPSPQRERSTSRAVSVLRAASSFINFDEIY